jgi:PPOX class probable F420-dependent enzyme
MSHFKMTKKSAEYLNLGTFRKTGARVDTPVWFAENAGILYVLSNSDAGKIKRLRNSSRCQIATCTFVGTPTGPWQESEAVLLSDPEEIGLAYNSLRLKYGWQMLLLDTGAWIGRRLNKRTYIKIWKP